MTRDDVIRVAREANIEFQAHTGTLCRLNVTTCGSQPLERIERFAHLVIADFLKRTGQYVTNDASREAATKEAVAPWKTAVIDQLVIAHILTAEHESDPLKAIQDLLAYHSDIAVDPRVSGAAAKLVERTKEACVKACMDEAGKWPYPSHGNAAASMCAKMIFDMRQK